MDGINSVPDSALLADDRQTLDRLSGLAQVVADLERSSAMLEALDLTLAVALLDHTMAEVRRQMTV